MKRTNIFLALIGCALPFCASAGEAAGTLQPTASPKGAKVYIIEPPNGATVTSPVSIKFGLAGMGVAPAGIDKENTGHHHLLVDGKQLPNLKAPLGQDVTHFGGGQTETSVELTPGKHTLQLILGDKFHIPHNPPVVSEKVTITVK